ncbi:MAG: hypothetical protein KTQ49_07730 [Candidatus Omnitrophica bacterium]|nr:hypothetical protein [Candidatus Omnitrophota bacterium]
MPAVSSVVPALRKILITAGPTREMLDPVRFISNLSTGEMGYAIARAAVRRKYQVTLVSGPTNLSVPRGVRFVPVTTSGELKKVCAELFPAQDCLIMAAAICDFAPRKVASQKISSRGGHWLCLRRTPDILASLAQKKGRRIVIGFCLETKQLIARAKDKLRRKRLDGIVANFYDPIRHIPFGDRRTKVVLIDASYNVRSCPRQSKDRTAFRLLDWIEDLNLRRSTGAGTFPKIVLGNRGK